MIVTFVSQCEKRAIKRTRKVLDAFANRIGQRTWQTVISDEGLKTVRQTLRKTASKNTAVACHLIRGRSQTDLLWVVGQRHQFNDQGYVPVNKTRKIDRYHQLETCWCHAKTIQILAAIAALLHDLGKSTVGFQAKLRGETTSCSDPYRHEWISVKLFMALINGCDTDEDWLRRFASFSGYLLQNSDWYKSIAADQDNAELQNAPPLARFIAWLIASHHRLPFLEDKSIYYSSKNRDGFKLDSFALMTTFNEFCESCFLPKDGWVKNKRVITTISVKESDSFWVLSKSVVCSPAWQKQMQRWANKALNSNSLRNLISESIESGSIFNPFLGYLTRLCLMVGDHNYSRLNVGDSRRLSGHADYCDLIANTVKDASSDLRLQNQSLDEHLIGVAKEAAAFAHILPQCLEGLPRLSAKHRALKKRTANQRFKWQNTSYELAQRIRHKTDESGFFGVNMASTGCGKTLANARIMHALGGENGSRFTVALGLRVLTLQTGEALQQHLMLDEDSLAILVGGTANNILHDLDGVGQVDGDGFAGSESAETLVKELLAFDEGILDDSQFGTVVADPKARRLLFSPVVCCTIDHIISATECLLGGRYIAPALRLLTSDLILDEPDEFNQEDLPALARLVHLAGMFGARIILSSATLTPDMLAGLYDSYRDGRMIFNSQMGNTSQVIVCAWFDEWNQADHLCEGIDSYKNTHLKFANKRYGRLEKAAVRRCASILPLATNVQTDSKLLDYHKLAEQLLLKAKLLHDEFQIVNSEGTKSVSVGLIRVANIEPLVELAKAFFRSENAIDNTTFHLCCYHARQLLMLRSFLEKRLDTILNRADCKSIFDHSEIHEAVHSTTAKHHVFIVLATPVAEVGRDHDYDWAIVEPSSMRSIIQLAGRVWRHRPELIAETPNIAIFDMNIKALSAPGCKVAFTRPGFESEHLSLEQHSIGALIDTRHLQKIDSIPRIIEPSPLRATQLLVDLEHAVMAEMLNSHHINYINAYWKKFDTANRAWGHLQLISPFRHDPFPTSTYCCMFDDETQKLNFYRAKQLAAPQNTLIQFDFKLDSKIAKSKIVKSWLFKTVDGVLDELALRLNSSTDEIARKFAIVDLQDRVNKWSFHPGLGFWENRS